MQAWFKAAVQYSMQFKAAVRYFPTAFKAAVLMGR